VTAATTVPEGGAGLGMAISPQGPVALGKSGSTLTTKGFALDIPLMNGPQVGQSGVHADMLQVSDHT
jgi:hypothetical protein